MELFFGRFEHLAEKIFDYCDNKTLLNAKLVSKDWKYGIEACKAIWLRELEHYYGKFSNELDLLDLWNRIQASDARMIMLKRLVLAIRHFAREIHGITFVISETNFELCYKNLKDFFINGDVQRFEFLTKFITFQEDLKPLFPCFYAGHYNPLQRQVLQDNLAAADKLISIISTQIPADYYIQIVKNTNIQASIRMRKLVLNHAKLRPIFRKWSILLDLQHTIPKSGDLELFQMVEKLSGIVFPLSKRRGKETWTSAFKEALKCGNTKIAEYVVTNYSDNFSECELAAIINSDCSRKTKWFKMAWQRNLPFQDPNFSPDNDTFLHLAAFNNALDIFKLIFEKIIKRNLLGNKVERVAHSAARGNSVAILRYLHANGVDLWHENIYGMLPMDVAEAMNNQQALEYLKSIKYLKL